MYFGVISLHGGVLRLKQLKKRKKSSSLSELKWLAAIGVKW